MKKSLITFILVSSFFVFNSCLTISAGLGDVISQHGPNVVEFHINHESDESYPILQCWNGPKTCIAIVIPGKETKLLPFKDLNAEVIKDSLPHEHSGFIAGFKSITSREYSKKRKTKTIFNDNIHQAAAILRVTPSNEKTNKHIIDPGFLDALSASPEQAEWFRGYNKSIKVVPPIGSSEHEELHTRIFGHDNPCPFAEFKEETSYEQQATVRQRGTREEMQPLLPKK